MSSTIDSLLERAKTLQEELETEYARRRDALGGRIEKGRLVFDHEVKVRQRLARMKFREYAKGIRPMVVITAPVIYSVIFAFLLMDLLVTLYMHVCFPVYGIPKVPRRDHIRIDRHHLAYLNGLQKLNCVYCGYCNGVLAWVREVAGRTEAYWCPIKHAGGLKDPHRHYAGFVDFGDGEGFEEGLARSRDKLGERTDEA